MPAFFGVISIGFPAALVVYWVTSSIYRIGLQGYITKSLYGGDESLGAQARRAADEARAMKEQGEGKGNGAAKRDAAPTARPSHPGAAERQRLRQRSGRGRPVPAGVQEEEAEEAVAADAVGRDHWPHARRSPGACPRRPRDRRERPRGRGARRARLEALRPPPHRRPHPGAGPSDAPSTQGRPSQPAQGRRTGWSPQRASATTAARRRSRTERAWTSARPEVADAATRRRWRGRRTRSQLPSALRPADVGVAVPQRQPGAPAPDPRST